MKTILDLGDLGDQEVEIEYDYTPGTPDVLYLSNGDPGYPGDPPEIIITSLKVFGVEIDPDMLINTALDTLYDEIEEIEQDNFWGDYIDRAEYDMER